MGPEEGWGARGSFLGAPGARTFSGWRGGSMQHCNPSPLTLGSPGVGRASL